MIPELRDRVLRHLAQILVKSGTFRRHLGDLDENFEPRFLRAAGLLRDATDAEAVFARDLANGVANDISLWVLHETRRKRGGYFVEFGAVDGIALSTTYLLEREYGWHGIVAEPNPAWHAALRNNRTAEVDFRCVFTTTGATVSFSATAAPLLSTIAAYASRDGHAGARRNHQTVQVETVSLNDLLATHAAPRDIDFVSVDTEGSEFDILSEFDFNYWNVLLFSIEHNLTDSERHLDGLMQRNGYERRYPGYPVVDAWYRRKPGARAKSGI